MSNTGSRQRHWPCSPAASHSTHSDHYPGRRHFAILGSPVYEGALHNTIVIEEPFFVTISLPPRRQLNGGLFRKVQFKARTVRIWLF